MTLTVEEVDFEVYLVLPPEVIAKLIDRQKPDFRHNPQLHFCRNFLREHAVRDAQGFQARCMRALIKPHFQAAAAEYLEALQDRKH